MKIRTKGYGYEVDIKVSVSRPTDLLIIAYDRTREQTVHIIRRYGEDVPLLGSKIFTLPFPIEPKQLIIKVLDFRTRRSIPFQTLKIRVNNPKLMPYTHMVKKFLHFAIDFSARMGTYKVGGCSGYV